MITLNGANVYSASVIIPTYNRGDLLALTLEALGRQSCSASDFEVIVCDDGSTDGTFELLSDFGSNINLKYVFYPDHGYHPTRARNMGLRLSEGKVAIFLDCGNLASPQLVEAHIRSHRDHASAVVLGYGYGNKRVALSAERVPEEIDVGDILGSIARMERVPHLADYREPIFKACEDAVGNLDTCWGISWAGNISVPLDAALAVGGFDETYMSWGGDDIDFGLALKLRGLDFYLSRTAATISMPHHIDMERRRKSCLANLEYLQSKYPDATALAETNSGHKMVKSELRRLGKFS